MREILFRGKRTDGVWEFGYYFAKPIQEKHFILCGENQWMVCKETIGQFTGFTDKNGKNIFEGDVVKVLQGKDKGVAYVGFENGSFMLYPRTGNIYERTLWAYWYNDWAVEIIGNIHDNPELLETT